MSSRFLVVVSAILALAVMIANARSGGVGSTVEVDNIYYFVPSTPVSKLGASWDTLKAAATSGDSLIPMTVMSGDFGTFHGTAFESTVAEFTARDDVLAQVFSNVCSFLPLRFIKLIMSNYGVI